jgi:polyhydroxyalkanoate synthase
VADGEQAPSTAAEWRSGAERHSGSWWEDWARWSDEHSGPLKNPPPMGSTTHAVLGDGPGTYVLT